MQIILDEVEFLDLKNRAISRDDFSSWKSRVHEQSKVTARTIAQIVPGLAGNKEAIEGIKLTLRLLEDEISSFPFEKIIKQ